MQQSAAISERATRLNQGAVVALVVVVSAVGGILTKKATTAPSPVLAAVDRVSAENTSEQPTIDVVAASLEATPERIEMPETTMTIVEIENPVGERTTEPTRWTDDDGTVWEQAPEGYERYYNGRPLVAVRTIWMTTTAYSPDHRSCGKWADGKTASMKSVWTNGMELVAADRRVLDFGTLLSIPGYAEDRAVPVLDVGGAIKGSRLDLLYPTHAIARQWGVQKLPVTVWEYADEVQQGG